MDAGWKNFGDYVLLAPIGRGATGEVYQARQTSLNRPVAVKVLRGAVSANTTVRERLRREAEAAARLRHPHIVPVYEVGEQGDVCYLSMAFMTGGSLADRLAGGPLDPRTAADVVAKMANVVQYAQSRGIIHRDIKPANILFDEQDQPHLSDFGVARLNDASTDLTLEGQLLGTPGYLAPEVIRHGATEATIAADIYSLGATLFQALTGKLPFRQEGLPALLRAIVEEPVPAPSSVATTAIPRDLEAICLKCLEKEPQRRYATAGALASDLTAFLRGEAVYARRPSSTERWQRWVRLHPVRAAAVVAVAVAVFAAVGGVAWGWHQSGQREAEALRSAAILRAEKAEGERHLADEELQRDDSASGLARLARVLRENPADGFAAARAVSVLGMRAWPFPATPPMVHEQIVEAAEFSPDGAEILTASRDGTVRFWHAESAQPKGSPLVHGEPVLWARYLSGRRDFLTATARTLRYWRGGETTATATNRLVSDWSQLDLAADGRALVSVGADGHLSWLSLPELRRHDFTNGPVVTALLGRDAGTVLAVDRWQQLLEWEVGTGISRRLTAPSTSPIQVLFAPEDRSWLAGVGPHQGVFRHDSAESGWRDLGIRAGAAFSYGGVAPDGRSLLFGGMDYQVSVWDVPSGMAVFPPIALRHRVTRVAFDGAGLRVALGLANGTVEIRDLRSGSPLSEPMTHPNRVRTIRFSPDGRRLLTACSDGRARLWELSGPRNRPLPLPMQGAVGWVGFSPDERWLAAMSKGGLLQLWSASAPEQAALSAELGGSCDSVCWSADSTRLVALGAGKTLVSFIAGPELRLAWRREVMYAPLEGTIPLSIGVTQGIVGGGDGSATVFSLTDGHEIRRLHHGSHPVHAIALSRDERFALTGGEDGRVLQWDIASGTVRQTLPSHDYVVGGADFSADGRTAAAFGHDGVLRIWETESGKILQRVRHQDGIISWTRSPGGMSWFTGTLDHQAAVWSCGDGRPRCPWFDPGREITGAAFLGTGEQVVTATADGWVQTWSCASGEALSERWPFPGAVTEIAASPRSRRVAAAREHGVVDLWEDVTPTGAAPDWFPVLAEAVAGKRLLANGYSEDIPADQSLSVLRRIQTLEGDDPWTRWARWLVVGGGRSLAPGWPLSTALVAERMSQVPEERSVRASVLMAVEQPTLLRALAAISQREASPAKPWSTAAAAALLRQANFLEESRK
jgi:WD40 repeat protein/tRNA A-37 threonylcarbamoyl transferase component Bud32